MKLLASAAGCAASKHDQGATAAPDRSPGNDSQPKFLLPACWAAARLALPRLLRRKILLHSPCLFCCWQGGATAGLTLC